MPEARGLSFTLAWQRSRSTDLDKDTLAIPTTLPYAEDRSIDVANLLLESPDKANEITRTVLSASLSYKILDQYTVAAGFESRSIDTDAVYFFEPCASIEGDSCIGADDPTNQLKQSAYFVSLSSQIDPSLVFTLEYGKSTYAKLQVL